MSVMVKSKISQHTFGKTMTICHGTEIKCVEHPLLMCRKFFVNCKICLMSLSNGEEAYSLDVALAERF